MSQEAAAPASASSPASATLLGYLGYWAVARRRAIAIRHKSHGVWVAWTWGDLQAEVGRVAVTLAARGFEPGDVVVIAAGFSPQALVVTLAAQGLGGAATWIEPEDARERADDSADGETAVVSPAARFGFARDEAALAALRARIGMAGAWALGIFTAEHGSLQEDVASAVRAYADVAGDDGESGEAAALSARPHDVAFSIGGDGAAGGRAGARRRQAPQSLSHTALITAARAWLDANVVKTGHEAFAWEAPTTEAAATFIAGWLVGGISLTLPEEVATADADRREVQPTIVAATAAAYERLGQQVADSLPARGSLLRAVVDAGLASAAGARVPRVFGGWLVRRPLRKVLGFRRAEVALLLGSSPATTAAQELLGQLGVPLRALLPRGSGAETATPAPRVAAPPADQSTLFKPGLALASPSSPLSSLSSSSSSLSSSSPAAAGKLA